MDNLLKILPLMNMPEVIRQPLLLDALAGKGNAMVGFIAARQASDAAISVVAEKDQALAANATTMARLETFHGAMIAGGAVPEGLKTFEPFKSQLLQSEASAKAVGSRIVCSVVEDGQSDQLEAAEEMLREATEKLDTMYSRIRAFHAALVSQINVSELGDFRRFVDALERSDGSASDAATTIRGAISSSAAPVVK